MLLYYNSCMFYNHFIATLYHFLGLTYWFSAQCQLLFFCFFFTSQKINTKRSPNAAKLCGFLWTRRHPMGQRSTWGCPEGGTTHQGVPGPPGAPMWVVPNSMASRTPSLHYKFPNIPKPFGVNLDHKFRCCKVSLSTKTNLDPVPALRRILMYRGLC